MGCDIHLFTERRADSASAWEPFVVRTVCSWCDGTGKNRDGAECYGCKGSGKEPGYSGRNYDVFGQLANVRNGIGCCGVDTGDGFEPIAMPRGFPPDLSPALASIFGDDEMTDDEYDAAHATYGSSGGDHTPSWLTLAELLAYQSRVASRRAIQRGVISWDQYLQWRESDRGEPNKGWSGGVSGLNVVTVDTKTAERMIARGFEPGATQYYVQIQWTEPYLSSGARFWEVFVPALAEHGDPQNVRIVFNFDS
jgi:hypothetical protein